MKEPLIRKWMPTERLKKSPGLHTSPHILLTSPGGHRAEPKCPAPKSLSQNYTWTPRTEAVCYRNNRWEWKFTLGFFFSALPYSDSHLDSQGHPRCLEDYWRGNAKRRCSDTTVQNKNVKPAGKTTSFWRRKQDWLRGKSLDRKRRAVFTLLRKAVLLLQYSLSILTNIISGERGHRA